MDQGSVFKSNRSQVVRLPKKDNASRAASSMCRSRIPSSLGILRFCRIEVGGGAPILIDRFLQDAVEIDVDALSDGRDVFISPAGRPGPPRLTGGSGRGAETGSDAAPVGSYQRRAPRSMRRCSGGALAEGSRRVASRPRVKRGASFHRAPARHARAPSRASPSPA